MKTKLLPLFDNISNISLNISNVILPNEDKNAFNDFYQCINFLKCYVGSQGTFNSYRREIEKLMQWTLHIKKKYIQTLTRTDLEDFINFCQNPPSDWISLQKYPRFIEKEGKRIPNPNWKPFVATVSKFAKKNGQDPDINKFSLSQGSTQEIFAILSTFFNFLIAEEYITSNPVALIRQKSKFIQKRQQNAPVRRLSNLQWQITLEVAENMATQNPELHERTKFILTLLFGMYLRISELAANSRWIPTMNDFSKDSNGNWWFTTIGKGNKSRIIAVSDDMLNSLKRWRKFLGLSDLPTPSDNSPLLPKVRGKGPISDPAPIRRLVQICFDKAEIILRQQGLNEEADSLMSATVHWLRHTAISEDVKQRPREHVRDDAGHSSSITTDRYIDVELIARHRSAKDKKIDSQDNNITTS